MTAFRDGDVVAVEAYGFRRYFRVALETHHVRLIDTCGYRPDVLIPTDRWARMFGRAA